MRIYLLLIFLFLNLTTGNASECGCDPNADLNIRQIIDADLIFKGHVINKRTEYLPSLGYRYVATFWIDEVISGDPVSDTVDIEFGYGSDFCSIGFQPLFHYLIVASKGERSPYFQTGYCSGNKNWENLSSRDHGLLFDFQNGKNELEWKDRFHKVYAKGRVSQKKAVGLWQYFAIDGQIKESGYYLEGKKEGDWFTFFHPVAICFQLELPLVGQLCDLSKVIPPHPSGWVSSLTPYNYGRIDGTLLRFRESGCVESESYFKSGKMIGSVIRY